MYLQQIRNAIFYIMAEKNFLDFYQMGLHPDYRKDPYECKRKMLFCVTHYASCIKLIDASVLLF